MTNISIALTALSDPTRREIFERLARGPTSVSSLAKGLPVSRPAVSQHLRALKNAGLVIDQADGTKRIYRIDPQGLGALRGWLDRFSGEALGVAQAAAEATPDLSDREEN